MRLSLHTSARLLALTATPTLAGGAAVAGAHVCTGRVGPHDVAAAVVGYLYVNDNAAHANTVTPTGR
jgi:hypothetical protein